MTARDAALLDVRGLRKEYRSVEGFARRPTVVAALRGVDLHVRGGSLFGLAGASGSGKSTLARCLASLENPTSGAIFLDGSDLVSLPPAQRRGLAARIQMVFQDPATSLNPRLLVGDAIVEPIGVKAPRRTPLRARASALMDSVDLAQRLATLRVAELSGGQKQRVALARAIAAEPSLLVLDEPFSALDPLRQRDLVELLLRLKREQGLTCLLISHDLRLMANVVEELAVIHAGRIVEVGPTRAVLANSSSPHTRDLIRAVRSFPRSASA